MYYRGAAAAVVVFDIQNKDSFKRAQSWVEELREQGEPNALIALCANKVDLNPNTDLGDKEMYANEKDLMFFRTSAKTGEGIIDMFAEITAVLIEEELKEEPKDTINFDMKPAKLKKDKGGCC